MNVPTREAHTTVQKMLAATRTYRPLYNFEEEEVVCLSTMTNYARGRMQEDWEGVHSIFRARTVLFGGGPWVDQNDPNEFQKRAHIIFILFNYKNPCVMVSVCSTTTMLAFETRMINEFHSKWHDSISHVFVSNSSTRCISHL